MVFKLETDHTVFRERGPMVHSITYTYAILYFSYVCLYLNFFLSGCLFLKSNSFNKNVSTYNIPDARVLNFISYNCFFNSVYFILCLSNHILSLFLYTLFKLSNFDFLEEFQNTTYIFICSVQWNHNDFQLT